MEYVVTASRPFEEVEALAIAALEKQGLVVQRTFSLRSAAGASGASTNPPRGTVSSPGFSVLMLYAAAAPRRPLGLITLYERGRRTVINPVITPLNTRRTASPPDLSEATSPDLDAELVAGLVLGGLEFCVGVAGGEECIDTGALGRRIQDPVCGKWMGPGQAETGIEHGGIIYHLCCSLCRQEFEREPERYARSGKSVAFTDRSYG